MKNKASTETKKIKGRKRHIIVDILGNLLMVIVHAANIHDTKGGCEVLERAKEKYPTIQGFSADQGYCKTALEFCADKLKIAMEISKRIKDGFAVMPKRWVVERTFSWLGHYRRLNRDMEHAPATAENMVRIAMIKITLAKAL